MAVQNSVRSYVGIAKEVTKGTAVQPTDFIPVAAGSLKPVNIIDPLYDEGLRGSAVKSYNYIQGRTRSTFDFGGAVFADTIGYPLAGILGEDVVTFSDPIYEHEISLINSTTVGTDIQPNSYTLTDFSGVDVRHYPGIQFHDFSLKFSADGLLEYDAKATGWLSTTTTATAPDFSDVLPQAVWTGTVSVGGTALATAMSGNIDMKRPVTPIYGISNTQNPYQVFVGALETSGKITFVMVNDGQLVNYLTNTQPAIELVWESGSGANAVAIVAQISKGAYVAAANDRSKDFVDITIDLMAQGNTTDAGVSGGYSNIKWFLNNQNPSGTYTTIGD
jgi:hypothetical protein